MEIRKGEDDSNDVLNKIIKKRIVYHGFFERGNKDKKEVVVLKVKEFLFQ